MDLRDPYYSIIVIYINLSIQKKCELQLKLLEMRFVRNIHVPISSSTDRSIQWTQRDLLFRDVSFSRKAVDGRPFFHRSSTAHGKIFPQLYYRLDHATIVH